MSKSGMPYSKALSYALQGKVVIGHKSKEYPISIALVGHGYNIYDERVCMKVIDKLEKMDVQVYTSLQLSDEQLDEGIASLGNEKYWANEDEMTGTAGHYLKDTKVDGVITITAFGCGPDSLMVERITRRAKQFNKPLLNLTIDEQTGEAGFVTRIEAFVDMLFRKKRASIVNKLSLSDGTSDYTPNVEFIETK
jgi:predicted nucleotide-binding protein (sugar kinase/HSP70/actin superfamily)